MNSRKHTRYRVEYVGLFSGERVSAKGVILDLSSAGCRARSEDEFNKGELLGVLIDVPRYEHPLYVTFAVVRWSNGREFGMEFIRMAPDDQQRLHQLIKQTEAAQEVLQTQPGDSVGPN